MFLPLDLHTCCSHCPEWSLHWLILTLQAFIIIPPGRSLATHLSHSILFFFSNAFLTIYNCRCIKCLLHLLITIYVSTSYMPDIMQGAREAVLSKSRHDGHRTRICGRQRYLCDFWVQRRTKMFGEWGG